MKKKKRQVTYEDITRAILGSPMKKLTTISAPAPKTDVFSVKLQQLTSTAGGDDCQGWGSQVLQVDKDGNLSWSKPKRKKNGLQILRLVGKREKK